MKKESKSRQPRQEHGERETVDISETRVAGGRRRRLPFVTQTRIMGTCIGQCMLSSITTVDAAPHSGPSSDAHSTLRKALVGRPG